MQSLDKRLYNLTKSEHWSALQEYLNINKDIIENHLYHSHTGYIEKPTNGAVVLIKMREVYQLLLSLPESLKTLAEDEKSSETIADAVNKIIDELG